MSALEEKLSALDRVVKGNSAGLASLESTQAGALARISALEAGKPAGGASGGSNQGGAGAAARDGVVHSAAVTEALRQVGFTPDAWRDVVAKAAAVAEVQEVGRSRALPLAGVRAGRSRARMFKLAAERASIQSFAGVQGGAERGGQGQGLVRRPQRAAGQPLGAPGAP